MSEKRLKLKYILITIFIVFFLSLFFLYVYTVKVSTKISELSTTYFKSDLYNYINSCIISDFSKNAFDNIIIVNKNDAGEIILLDFDLKKAYSVLNEFTDVLKQNRLSYTKEIPFFVGTSNIFLYNIGPKLKVKLNYIYGQNSKVYTKVSDYGLNNALIEVYLKIDFIGVVINPLKVEEINYSYDFLLTSKVVNGRVPTYFRDISYSS